MLFKQEKGIPIKKYMKKFGGLKNTPYLCTRKQQIMVP